MSDKKRKKENDIFSTVENNRSLESGMPSGDPNNGTKWTDTLIYMVIIIVLFVIYALFFR